MMNLFPENMISEILRKPVNVIFRLNKDVYSLPVAMVLYLYLFQNNKNIQK